MTLDPHVYALAAQRLSDVRYTRACDYILDQRDLAETIQRAIEQWEQERQARADAAADPANDPRLP